jgi:integrating conjugative element protein (TIGR03746 family)
MSTPHYLDALASERRHTAMLVKVIFAVAAVGAVSTYFAWRIPKQLNVHLLPNLSPGSMVEVDGGTSAIPPANIYSFAFYIWQQINRWNADGAKDYGQQIFRMQNYITPQCIAQLRADMEARQKAGELQFRSRQISEIPGFGFGLNRVVASPSETSWTVLLDSQVQETFRGNPVKDVYIRYPIRVVRFDVDRERNPWQLAIDCYGSHRPARLSDAELRPDIPGTPARKDRPLTVPTLPSAIAPPALPEALPLDGAAEVAGKPE